jgi:hypothetical protein
MVHIFYKHVFRYSAYPIDFEFIYCRQTTNPNKQSEEFLACNYSRCNFFVDYLTTHNLHYVVSILEKCLKLNLQTLMKHTEYPQNHVTG